MGSPKLMNIRTVASALSMAVTAMFLAPARPAEEILPEAGRFRFLLLRHLKGKLHRIGPLQQGKSLHLGQRGQFRGNGGLQKLRQQHMPPTAAHAQPQPQGGGGFSLSAAAVNMNARHRTFSFPFSSKSNGGPIPYLGLFPPRTKEDLSVSLHQAASFRHRGAVIEGADSVENVLDFIDWLPKVGYNSFFTQFMSISNFLRNWYCHIHNPLLPRHISAKAVSRVQPMEEQNRSCSVFSLLRA